MTMHVRGAVCGWICVRVVPGHNTEGCYVISAIVSMYMRVYTNIYGRCCSGLDAGFLSVESYGRFIHTPRFSPAYARVLLM